MINEDFNKAEIKKATRKQYFSKKDIMVKGKRVSFETSIKNYNLSELIYGEKNKRIKDSYAEIWENFRRYN